MMFIFKRLKRNCGSALMMLVQHAIIMTVVVNSIVILSYRIHQVYQPTGLPEDELLILRINYNIEDNNLLQIIQDDFLKIKEVNGIEDAFISNSSYLLNTRSTQVSSEINSSADEIIYVDAFGDIINTFKWDLIDGENFDEMNFLIGSRSNLSEGVIITQSVAEKFFPNKRAVGSTLFFGDALKTPVQVIGVIKQAFSWRDSKQGLPLHKHERIIIPRLLEGHKTARIHLNAPEANRESMLQNIKEKLGPNPKREIRGLIPVNHELKRHNDKHWDMITKLSIITVAVLFIIGFGIFSLTQLWVRQGVKQIGIYRALGAQKSTIVKMLLIDNGLVCLTGCIIGISLALALNLEFIKHFSLDGVKWQHVALTLLIQMSLTFLASLLPALEATRISPSLATRTL